MSDSHFHVHAPHDHAVEHQAHAGDQFAARIAVVTAVLSTVGALFSFQGGTTQNEALLFKNEASLRKTEASDQWSYYQAKGNKQNLAELGASLTQGELHDKFIRDIERYKAEKEEIRASAMLLDQQAQRSERESADAMVLHHRWAQSATCIQVGISLAAITLLTRRNWLKYCTFAFAGGGMVLALMALMHL